MNKQQQQEVNKVNKNNIQLDNTKSSNHYNSLKM